MKPLFLSCCLLFLAGCASTQPSVPHGTLLFYVKITNVALGKAPAGDTGVFLFSEDDHVTAYEMRAGSVRATYSRDPAETASLSQDIAAIDFIPFDFEAEVKNATIRREARLKAAGKSALMRFDLDGSEFEIGFDGPKGKFVLRYWNPGSKIDDLAGDSENIAKLKRLIDRFAAYYGQSRFGL